MKGCVEGSDCLLPPHIWQRYWLMYGSQVWALPEERATPMLLILAMCDCITVAETMQCLYLGRVL